MKYACLKNNKGNSLLEVVLYTGIAAMIVMVVGYSVQGIFQIKVKSETVSEVEQQAVQAINMMSQTIRNASSIVAIVETGTPIQDIKIQRGQADISNTGGTQVAPTNFTAFSSMESSFVLNQNNRYTNSGLVGSTNNKEVDDMSGALALTDASTISFYREPSSAADLARFHWEAWEYIGPAEGANEFIVRGRFQVTILAGGRISTDTVTACDNINKCIPFITGILNDDSTDDADDATALAWMSANNTVSVERGGTDGNTDVYGVVVEFIGSNWSVAHGRTSDTADDTGFINLVEEADGLSGGTTYEVDDWSDAIIFHQFKADDNNSNEAVVDTSATYFPGTGTSTSEVEWYFEGGHDGVDNQHMVHVLENKRANVTRYTSTGNAQGDNNINISSAGLTDLSNSAIVGSSNGNNTGAAYGRGWKGIYLTSLTNASAWGHRSDDTVSTRVQIIDVPNTAEGEEIELNLVGGGSIKFGAVGGRIYVDEGSGLIYLTSENVYVSGLDFKDVSRPNTPGLISYQFVISYNSNSNREEFNYSKSFHSSASILDR